MSKDGFQYGNSVVTKTENAKNLNLEAPRWGGVLPDLGLGQIQLDFGLLTGDLLEEQGERLRQGGDPDLELVVVHVNRDANLSERHDPQLGG